MTDRITDIKPLILKSSKYQMQLKSPSMHWRPWGVLFDQIVKNDMYGLLTKRDVKMAGYWLGPFLRVYGPDRDGVEVHKHAKKYKSNNQPSWPKKLDQ